MLPPLIDLEYTSVSGIEHEDVCIAATTSKLARESEWLTTMMSDCQLTEELEKLVTADSEHVVDLDELENLAQQMETENQCTSSVAKEKASVKKFEAFLRENNLQLDLHSAPTEEIAKYMRYFFASLKKQSGEWYSPNTVIGIRAGLYRFFLKIRSLDIIAEPVFHNVNFMLKYACDAFLPEGGRMNRYEAVEPADMEILGKYFDRSTPHILLQEVYFNILYYYGNRGREWLRGIAMNSFVEKRLATGEAAVGLIQGSSKNLHGSTSVRKMEDNKESLMVEKKGSEKCPVAAFRQFCVKIREVPGRNGQDFFLKPRRTYKVSLMQTCCALSIIHMPAEAINKLLQAACRRQQGLTQTVSHTFTNHLLTHSFNQSFIYSLTRLLQNGQWYTKQAMGVNTLSSLMKTIAESAGLSKPYTGHCVRATVVTDAS
jgi:hypothetical protein